MGTLYVVATPIGNLADITLRALDILDKVDFVICEDSRITKKLLQRYKLNTPTITYHQHSRDKKIDLLIDKLKSGQNLALVTDAGTPGIQDPGGKLVKQARKNGIDIIAIPGPSAVTTALSIAGIKADSFYFAGFIPKKKGRQTLLKQLMILKIPIVIYESPYRVIRTLQDIKKYLGRRQIIIAREITKKFEELIEGDTNELIELFSKRRFKGEFVIIILPETNNY